MSNPLRRWTLASKANANLRDLGGYACEGGVTRYGVLLRADQIYNLSEEDKVFLLKRGLTDIIDLRGCDERRDFPNAFLEHESVRVHSFGDVTMESFIQATKDMTSMGEIYVYMVEKLADNYLQAIDIISQTEGLTIFHCLVGKDRTGIVSALLLLLLGVDERDVIADYQVSETFLTAFSMPDLIVRPGIPSYVALSGADNMRALIEHINSKYGGALEYLRANGFTHQMHDRLKKKLVAS